MALYEIDPQERYLDYTDRWANFHQWTPRNGVKTNDADDQCCGQTYLERYFQSGGEEKIAKIIENLDNQMKTPNNQKPEAEGSLYGWWTWIDAIQMAMPVYSKMFRITGEQKYIDHAMRKYSWIRDTLAG
jgi:rhamnogalacturonyl hydrolase YesR